MITADKALEQLREGNKRFVSGMRRPQIPEMEVRRSELLAGQQPFAVILGCSDSRVPVELIFDQGLGDLFVVRVAGNNVSPTLVGSIEFAASGIGSPLVVVLGHSQCGAVKATLSELQKPTPDLSPNLAALVEQVRPSVEKVLADRPGCSRDELIERTVRANVYAVVKYLRTGSALLRDLIEKGKVRVIGAEYSLHSGEVTFLDGRPDTLA